MNWNFFDLVKKCGLYVGDIAQVPRATGVYRLFAANGKFIYVGNTRDLRHRLAYHFGPNEKNELIRGVAEYAIWELTWNLEEAEEAEGFLYDVWFHHNGQPPCANEYKPPKSTLSDSEILIANVRQLLRGRHTPRGRIYAPSLGASSNLSIERFSRTRRPSLGSLLYKKRREAF